MEKKKCNNKQARRNRLCQNIRTVNYNNNIVTLSFTYIVSPVVIGFTEVMVRCAEELQYYIILNKYFHYYFIVYYT